MGQARCYSRRPRPGRQPFRLWDAQRAATQLVPVRRDVLDWRRSPFAHRSPVEVAFVPPGILSPDRAVAVRRGDVPDGVALRFRCSEWLALCDGVVLGELDVVPAVAGRRRDVQRIVRTARVPGEVAAGGEPLRWLRSSFAGDGAVEVAWIGAVAGGAVGMRHAQAPDGEALQIPAAAFVAFTDSVRLGHFDTLIPASDRDEHRHRRQA